MTKDQREFLNAFKEVNVNAGCDPAIVELCLSYLRYCFAAGLPMDFDTIRPSIDEMFAEPSLSAYQRRYLGVLKDHFWQTDEYADSFAHLNLWYCYNLLSKGAVILFAPFDLAAELGLSVQALNYIASEKFPGYTDFEIPKPAGGTRHISAPVPKLRWIQRWILDRVLSAVPLSDCATAYLRKRSIRDNASPHLAAKVVVNLDLESFFPTITFQRVMGVYLSIGYTYPVAILLAKLSCHEGRLPQGAPTSPAISNLACRRLDSRMQGLGKAMNFEYTRYADDITFSGNGSPDGLIQTAKHIIEAEGFSLAGHKTRITRRGQSQRVTGLVVNERVNVPRTYYRRIRAIIHNCWRFGVESQNRDNHPAFKAHLYGHAHYIHSINPQLGKRLLDQLKQVDWES